MPYRFKAIDWCLVAALVVFATLVILAAWGFG